MINEDGHADADGGIRNIKSRPMGRANIKIQEVHYLAQPEPVNEVAYGPAEDKGQAIRQKNVGPGDLPVKPEDKQGHDGREEKENKFPDPVGLGGKKAERPAWIQHMVNIKEPLYDRYLVIEGKVYGNKTFGDLVGEDNTPAGQNQTFHFF